MSTKWDLESAASNEFFAKTNIARRSLIDAKSSGKRGSRGLEKTRKYPGRGRWRITAVKLRENVCRNKENRRIGFREGARPLVPALGHSRQVSVPLAGPNDSSQRKNDCFFRLLSRGARHQRRLILYHFGFTNNLPHAAFDHSPFVLVFLRWSYKSTFSFNQYDEIHFKYFCDFNPSENKNSFRKLYN